MFAIASCKHFMCMKALMSSNMQNEAIRSFDNKNRAEKIDVLYLKIYCGKFIQMALGTINVKLLL